MSYVGTKEQLLIAHTSSLAMFLTHLRLDKMAATLADDNFKYIFLNEIYRIMIWFSLQFVPRSPIYNKSALVQVVACHLFGARPLPEPMLTKFADAYMWH